LREIGDERKMCYQILALGQLYARLDQFYFDIFVDWRGRFYARGEYLNYQGHKAGLALLLFKERSHMTAHGLRHFLCYGARMVNSSGSTTSHLLEWVETHRDSISALNPKLIASAQNPPLFVAFCLEYAKAFLQEKPCFYVTGFPVLSDCSCNGLQHLSAMVCSLSTGSSVNLNPKLVRDDIYGLMATFIKNKLQLGIPLERENVKKVIMCVPYNVSKYAAGDYFISTYEYDSPSNTYYHKSRPEVRLSYKSMYEISQQVYTMFYVLNPDIKDVVTYFQSMASFLGRLNLPMVWVTPHGLVIKQKYPVYEKIRYKSIYNKRNITLNIATNVINRKKQANAFMPNVVHSMDGANLALTVLALGTSGVKNIFTIHDCFAGRPDDVEAIQGAVRKAFVELYLHRDFIKKIHTRCLDQLTDLPVDRYQIVYSDGDYVTVLDKETGEKLECPKMPVLGQLDISQIINAEHMIR
jgi:DNA-directed RNA polymerase